MTTLQDFSPAERLHAALRDRHPQLIIALSHEAETGLTRVHATYRRRGPLIIGWDGETYRLWSKHARAYGALLPSGPEDAADRLAEMLALRNP